MLTKLSIKILIYVLYCHILIRLLLIHPTWDKKFLVCSPTLQVEHLSRDFTICGIFRLFSWIGPLYSRIDLFRRPITVERTRSFDLREYLSRWQRQPLANPAGFFEIMLGSFRMLDFKFPPFHSLLLLYFYSFKHDRCFMQHFKRYCKNRWHFYLMDRYSEVLITS